MAQQNTFPCHIYVEDHCAWFSHRKIAQVKVRSYCCHGRYLFGKHFMFCWLFKRKTVILEVVHGRRQRIMLNISVLNVDTQKQCFPFGGLRQVLRLPKISCQHFKKSLEQLFLAAAGFLRKKRFPHCQWPSYQVLYACRIFFSAQLLFDETTT